MYIHTKLLICSVVLLCLSSFAKAADTSGKIPLRVEPAPAAAKAYPVSSGIPFPRGVLKDTKNIRVLDKNGTEMPAQVDLMSRWNDGSVMAALVSFQANVKKTDQIVYTVAPEKETLYTLEYGPAVSRKAAPSKPVTVTGAGSGTITVDTGAISFKIGEKSFALKDFTLGGKKVASAADLVLKAKGKEYRASATKKGAAKVEESGPLVACVKLTGTHSTGDEDYFDYIVRIYAYAGKPFVRVWYTIINKDDKTGPEDVEGWGIRFKVPGANTYAIGGEKEIYKGPLSGDVNLNQKGKNTISHYYSFSYEGAGKGSKAPGWIDIGNGAVGMTAKVRKFWQQFPKVLSAKPGEMTVWLYAPKPFNTAEFGTDELGEPKNLGYASGIAKTHEVYLYFHAGNHEKARSKEQAEIFEYKPFAKAPPEWYCKSGVFGMLSHTAGLATPFNGYTNIVDWYYEHIQYDGLEGYFFPYTAPRWYGTINFGDMTQNNSGNLYLEFPKLMMQQFITRDTYGKVILNEKIWPRRPGLKKDFQAISKRTAIDNKSTRFLLDLVEISVHHHMDIDVCHVNRTKGKWANLGPGMHWQPQRLANYPPAGVEKSPLYAKLKRRGNWIVKGSLTHHCGPTPEPHCSSASWAGHAGGMFEYWIVTGEKRPREVLVEQADYYLRLYKSGFKEKRHEPQHGWPLLTLMRAYHATGEKKYLDQVVATMKFVIKWWKEPEEYWIKGKKVGMIDSPRGYWAVCPANDAWTGSKGSRYYKKCTHEPKCTGATTSGSFILIQAVTEFYENNKIYKTDVDNKTIETMLVECMRFLLHRKWINAGSGGECVYKTANKPFNSYLSGGCQNPTGAFLFPVLYVSRFLKDPKEKDQWHKALKNAAGLPPLSLDRFKIKDRKYVLGKHKMKKILGMLTCNPNELGPAPFLLSVPQYLALYEKMEKEGKAPK